MPRPTRELYECVEPFTPATRKGEAPQVFGIGRKVFGDDPILRTHRAFFVRAEDRVEQATAAPGERRNVTIPEPPEPEVDPDKETTDA